MQTEIGWLTDAIVQVGISPALAGRLRVAEAELAALQSEPEQNAEAEAGVRDMSDIVARYRTLLDNLVQVLVTDVDHARELLREILGNPVMSADAEGHVWVTLDKETASMLSHEAVSTIGCGGRI
ncbi:hypothetical protein [Kerstersia similis]|uniref:hypothetical protein n=1 Tax=Kerstersia similis TaxID=206505 RepID=UPI0039EF7DF7